MAVLPTFKQHSLLELISATSWTVLGTGAGRILVLISMILVGRTLGPGAFGLLVILQSTLAVLGLLAGGGLGTLAIRSLSVHRLHNQDRAGRDLTLVLVTAVVLVSLVVLGLLACAPHLANSLSVDAAAQTESALRLGAAWLVVSAVRSLQDSILAGFEAFRVQSLVRCMEGALAVMVVPAMAIFFGLEGAVIGLASVGALAAVAASLPIFLLSQRHGIRLERPKTEDIRPALISTSLPAFFSGIVAVPVLWWILWDLARSAGTSEVGLYGAAYQWHGPLLFIPLALSAVSLPMLSRLNGTRATVQFRQHLIASVVLGLIVSVIPALIVAFCAPVILSFYGTEFLGAKQALIWLALAVPCHAVAKLTASGLVGRGYVWGVAALKAAWALVLVISYLTLSAPGAADVARVFCLSYLALAVGSVVVSALVERNVSAGVDEPQSLVQGKVGVQ